MRRIPHGQTEILRIGKQAVEGLAAAHAQGLVHRDVKPANILLEYNVGRLLLTDFGLARAVDDATMTRSGVIAGTPQYMSPEQAHGEAIDHGADLFSLYLLGERKELVQTIARAKLDIIDVKPAYNEKGLGTDQKPEHNSKLA